MRRLSTRVLAVSLGLIMLAVVPAQAVPSWKIQCNFQDKRFTEISGLTRSLNFPGVLYLNNDSSDGPYIYAVDERTCKTLATLKIQGSRARDYEAIASGRDARGRAVIWLADIGDNLDSWPYVEILRIREPGVLKSQTVHSRTVRVSYPDRPHNAETVLANPTDSQLWIVTKQLAHGSLYKLPKPLRKANTAVLMQAEDGFITDGAVSPQGDRYVLRTYFDATVYAGLPPGREQVTFDLPGQFQGEAITWTADGKALLIAGERDDRLLRVEIPQAG
ncbi:MAG: hypothetical protein Q7L55_07650 [Actinomycetota bacterium]|nr:hypothetical protein [Actinomycetota bacterium]